MKDPKNLDAFISYAFLHTAEQAGSWLQLAEENGRFMCITFGLTPDFKLFAIQGRKTLKARLGPDCFKDGSKTVGKFWDILDTRPYMRVLQAQVRIYVENKKYKESASVLWL